MWAELWRYRAFIRGTVRREFATRYRSSLLGGVWAVLVPLTWVVVYSVVLGRVMRVRLPGGDGALSYGFFVCAGVVTWTMFSELINRSVAAFVEQASLLKNARFPRASLPVIVWLSATAHFAIACAVLLLALLAAGRLPGWPLLALVPLVAVQQAIGLGIGLALGVLNVFVRDVAHFAGIALALWFWLTPIVYPLEVVTGGAHRLIALNPITPLVLGYQRVLIHGAWPDWGALALPALFAAAAMAAGLAIFHRLSPEMADNL
jgi:lipopolysaccharide transport system permease protein